MSRLSGGTRLCLAIIALVLLAAPLAAQQQPVQPPPAPAAQHGQPLVVEVQLVQGSAGGPPPPAALSVQLVMMTEQSPMRTSFAALTDDSGLARIEVDRHALGSGLVRTLAVTLHNDMRFYSEPMMLTSATPSPVRVSLSLHEPSADAAAMEVVTQTIAILGQRPEGLAMQEMITIANPTDRVIASRHEDAPLLTDTLPRGVIYDPQRSTSIVRHSSETNQLFYYGPFMPGDTQVVISYHLPVSDWPVALRKPLGLVPAERISVAMATRAFDIRGPLGTPHVDRNMLAPVPLLVRDRKSVV